MDGKPLPDSRPFLERLLQALDEFIDSAEAHLSVSAARVRIIRGEKRAPLPPFRGQIACFPIEVLPYVPECGGWLLAFREASEKQKSLASESEDCTEQRLELENKRISSLRKVVMLLRLLRLRVLEKLGQWEGIASGAQASEPTCLAAVPAAEPGDVLTPLEKALAMLMANPDKTDKQIAADVGVHVKTMNKPAWKKYKAARAALAGSVRKGSKVDGRIEAEYDSNE